MDIGPTYLQLGEQYAICQLANELCRLKYKKEEEEISKESELGTELMTISIFFFILLTHEGSHREVIGGAKS